MTSDASVKMDSAGSFGSHIMLSDPQTLDVLTKSSA